MKNPFLRKVLILLSGTASAQLLSILVSPILTRIYSPEVFGLLAFYLGVISVLATISSFRYETAILMPKDDDEALKIAQFCFNILLINSFIVLVVFLTFKDYFFGSSQYIFFYKNYWVFPFGVFAVGLYQILNNLALRKQSFSAISQTKITQVISVLILQLIGSKFSSHFLIYGQAVGQTAGVYRLFLDRRKNYKREVRVQLDNITVLTKYSKFLKYSMPSALLNSLGGQLPAILLIYFFSPAMAGFYAITQRVLRAPMTLIGGVIANVFTAQSAEMINRNEKIDVFIENVILKLIAIVFFPMGGLFLLSPQLFPLVFGEEWAMAGIFAQWMIPWLTIVFITSPITLITEITAKNKNNLIFQVSLFASRLFGIGIGALNNSALISIASFSILSFICWLIYLTWLTKTYHVQYKNILKSVAVHSLIVLSLLGISYTLGPYYYLGIILFIIFYLLEIKRAFENVKI